MTRLSHQREWEDLAGLDPLWAILSERAKRHNRWRHDEFFGTGEAEVQEIVSWTKRCALPVRTEHALDFGCGVGRLSRALAARFEACVGVDISPTMIEQARALNSGIDNLRFVLGDAERLPPGGFDLVLTLIVLQHLPRRSDIFRAVAALSAKVRPGGALVVGIPTHIPLRPRLQPRQRSYRLLRSLGVDSQLLYERLGLHPIRMQAVTDQEMREMLSRAGLEVVDARISAHPSGIRTSVYLAARR